MTKPNNTKAAEEKLAEAARIEEQKAAHAHSRAELLATAGNYGRDAAAGQTSLTALAFFFNDACRRGFTTEGDARAVYTAYAEAHNAAIEAGKVLIGNVEYRVVADKLLELEDNKTPVSEFRSFGRPHVVAQGLAMYQDVIAVANGMPKEARDNLSVYQCMVRVNRRVSEAAETLGDAFADFIATPEWIRECIATPEAKKPEPKTFAQRLDRLVADMAKLVKKDECPDLRTVYDALEIVAAQFKLDAAKAKVAPLGTLVKADEIGSAPAIH